MTALLTAWSFSSSWSYDVHILLKYACYLQTWLPHMVLSSVLCFAAGLLWNLQYRPGGGAVLGFMQAGCKLQTRLSPPALARTAVHDPGGADRYTVPAVTLRSLLFTGVFCLSGWS